MRFKLEQSLRSFYETDARPTKDYSNGGSNNPAGARIHFGQWCWLDVKGRMK
jgi:hypothetical protein